MAVVRFGRLMPVSRAVRAAPLWIVLFAAACAQQGGRVPVRSAAPPPPPRAVAPAEQPQAQPQTPEPPEARNRVALLVPTSGPQAAVGQSIANAALLALIDVKDPRFRLTTYDTAAAGGARAAAEQAVSNHAGVILGPLLAGDVRAAAPVAAAAHIPMLSFTNDAALAGGGVYVMGFQPAQAIERVVNFARGKGVERFAALIPNGAYGARASTAFLRAVQASGGSVTGIANYARDRRALVTAARKVTAYEARLQHAGTGAVRPDGTVAPLSERLGAAPFQALLIADTGTLAAAFGPSLAQFGAGPGTVKLLGTELWATEPGIGRAPGLRGAWFASVPGARFAQMAVRYQSRYGARPSRLASLGYDGVLLVQSLADRWPLGEPFPVGSLSAAGGFTGVDGAFRFTPSGVAQRAMEVRQVSAGGSVVVSPAATAFH